MKFNKEQLVQLDSLDPFIDEQETESRKGYVQYYPLMHLYRGQEYWCVITNTVKVIDESLIGTWINTKITGDQYLSWKDIRLDEWYKAVQKEFVETRWVSLEEV